MKYQYETKEMDELVKTLNSTSILSGDFKGAIITPFFVDPSQTEKQVEIIKKSFTYQLFLNPLFEKYVLTALKSLVDYRRRNGFIPSKEDRTTKKRRPDKNSNREKD